MSVTEALVKIESDVQDDVGPDAHLSEDRANAHSVALQCGSEKSYEDSNIVLVKCWSDDEEEVGPPEEALAENKKVRRRERRELKRKLEAAVREDVTNKKVKTEVCGPESNTANIKEERSENLEADINGADVLKSNSSQTLGAQKSGCANSRPGYSDDRFNETSYYYDSGLRKVYPYYFTFTTYTKGRWVGDTILDVFSREFRAHPAEEYKRCIEAGTLTVNYEKVPVDYPLKHNDLLANVVHRHEVPVVNSPIEVVHIDKDVVVINKPASIPVHPCGRYRHNTIVFILAKEYNLKNLRTIHRLDRLTSGMLMFGRSVKKALQLEEQIRRRLVQKEYVCRVEGDFPYEMVECKEPIEVVSFKIGVCKVSAKGKDCSTTFKKVGYNPKTNISVIRCMPHTGRMHQIRVHLQYLGFPVLRDPLYNHPVFGPEKGKGGRIGKTDEELIKDLIHIHNAESWLGVDEKGDGGMMPASLVKSSDEEEEEASATSDDASGTQVEDLPQKSVGVQTNYDEPDSCFVKEKLTKEPTCSECKLKYRDPNAKDLIMYLHALRYEGPDWAYETSLPEWADVNWVED